MDLGVAVVWLRLAATVIWGRVIKSGKAGRKESEGIRCLNSQMLHRIRPSSVTPDHRNWTRFPDSLLLLPFFQSLYLQRSLNNQMMYCWAVAFASKGFGTGFLLHTLASTIQTSRMSKTLAHPSCQLPIESAIDLVLGRFFFFLLSERCFSSCRRPAAPLKPRG